MFIVGYLYRRVAALSTSKIINVIIVGTRGSIPFHDGVRHKSVFYYLRRRHAPIGAIERTMGLPLLRRRLALGSGQPVKTAVASQTHVAIMIDTVAMTIVAIAPALGQTLFASNRFGLAFE